MAEAKPCELCLQKHGRYTCPRCNIHYCSADCYKSEKHANCSETFYRDCFMDALKEKQISSEDKKKMLETLAKYEDDPYGLESDDSDDDLEARLAGLDLDNDTDEIWQHLSANEKREFQAMVQDGRLGNLVELWQAWWLEHDDALVRELNVKPKPPSGQPDILTDVKDIETLTKSKPSEAIKYGIINVLYGYCYLIRLHNGDYSESHVEFYNDLMSISDALGPAVFKSTSDALQGAMMNLQTLGKAKHLIVSQAFAIGCIEDVKHIVQGQANDNCCDYVLAALSDVHTNFTKAKKCLDDDIKATTGQPDKIPQLKKLKKEVFKTTKGIEFKLSWVGKYYPILTQTVPELELELCSLLSDLATQEKVKNAIETKWKGPRVKPKETLIDELD